MGNPMTDTIFIRGLLVHAHHGVMEHESRVGQQFSIDLDLKLDLSRAAASDKLADTISYAVIVDEALRAFTAQSFKLVVKAAGVVGRQRCQWCRLHPGQAKFVAKPLLQDAARKAVMGVDGLCGIERSPAGPAHFGIGL